MNSPNAANTPEREAPCGCKWYADGTTYKCLSHRRFDGDPRAERIEPSAAYIAALYVETGGVYFDLPGVDPWDEQRDARLYGGPYPVVAHPPCSRWSRLAGFCEARYGLKVGHDQGCFATALGAVRRFGGVLEHPAFSKAWAHFDLPRPETKHQGWTLAPDGGASCYIEQGNYGHAVKKATWLYAYGVELPQLRWGHTPDNRGTLATNQDWRGGMDKWRDATGYKIANATPLEFRDELIAIARSAYAYREVAA